MSSYHLLWNTTSRIGRCQVGRSAGEHCQRSPVDTNTGIVKDLDPSRASAKLEELRRDFNDILEEGQIKIQTFQESAGIAGLKLVSSKVVPDESSSFDSRKYELVDSISANHMNMCRFGSKDDDGYKKFVGALAIFLEQIDGRSGEIAERMKAERKEELLHSLDFAERQAREHQLSSADTATFDWIWADKPSGTTFAAWLSCRRGLFWISGKPGSGKSTLMNYLAGEMKTISLLRKSTDLPWTIIRFFFDFRAGRGTANNLEGLLRTLLLQLVQNVPELTTRVLEFGKDRFSESQCLDWPQKKVRRSLQEGHQACPCNVCIFVDGLDEYEGNMLDLVTVLRDIDDSCSDLAHTVKLCLASRPEPLLSATLQGSAGFRMQDHNLPGIQQYVRLTLKHIRTATGDDAFMNMSSHVAERSEGVFLWARLAINELIDGHVAGDTREELLERLKQVPSDLRDVYSRIFSRFQDMQKDEANTILLLVCGAKRTLTLEELCIAVHIAGKKDLIPDEDECLSFASLKAFRRRVLAKTGGLLEIADIEDPDIRPKRVWEVKLIHETVRPFVEKNQGVIFRPPRLQDVAAPRNLWLEVCVAALQPVLPVVKVPDLISRPLEDGARKILRKKVLNRMKEQFRLAEYAVLFLFDHARDLEMLDRLSSYGTLRSIMAKNLYCLHAEVACSHRYPYPLEVSSRCKWCDGNKKFREGVYVANCLWTWAAIHGLPRYCENAVASEGIPPYNGYMIEYAMNICQPGERVDDSYVTMILAVITLLLKQNVSVQDKDIIRALQLAPPLVLDLLLRDRPCGNLRLMDSSGEIVGPFWILMCKKYPGSYFRRTVDYLLKRGEVLDGNCGPAGTALHAPLWAWSSGVMWRYEILLKKGADPNVPGPAGTPLQLLWKRSINGRAATTSNKSGYQALMQLVLQYGAVIHWVDEDGITPTKEEIRAYCDLGSEVMWVSSKEDLRMIRKAKSRAEL